MTKPHFLVKSYFDLRKEYFHDWERSLGHITTHFKEWKIIYKERSNLNKDLSFNVETTIYNKRATYLDLE